MFSGRGGGGLGWSRKLGSERVLIIFSRLMFESAFEQLRVLRVRTFSQVVIA